jgi:hypothetical protein
MLVQTERRFKIFVVPARDQSFVSFCFQLIGQEEGLLAQQETALLYIPPPHVSQKR